MPELLGHFPLDHILQNLSQSLPCNACSCWEPLTVLSIHCSTRRLTISVTIRLMKAADKTGFFFQCDLILTKTEMYFYSVCHKLQSTIY